MEAVEDTEDEDKCFDAKFGNLGVVFRELRGNRTGYRVLLQCVQSFSANLGAVEPPTKTPDTFCRFPCDRRFPIAKASTPFASGLQEEVRGRRHVVRVRLLGLAALHGLILSLLL